MRHVLDNGICTTCQDEAQRARHVRTAAGVKKYGLPIGSVIGGGGALDAAPKAPVKAPARPARQTLKAQLVERLKGHLAGDAKGDPFEGFEREQLRRVARARGIELARGESRGSIAAKLKAHIKGDLMPADAGQPAKAVEKPAVAPIPNGRGGAVRPLRAAPGGYRDLSLKHLRDSDTEAAALHKRMQAGRPWTWEQREALVDYSGEAFRRMNGVLRGTATSTPEVRRLNDDAHAAMREIPENIVTHRGVTSHAFGFYGAPISDAQAAALVGRTFHDPAFTSTSINPRPSGSLLLRVSVPAGTRGAYITSISKNDDEFEMLLDRGTHYKITKFERDKYGALVLHVTVVGQDE